MARAQHEREPRLTPEYRDGVLAEKFEPPARASVTRLLGQVVEPTDQVISAILFLARPGCVDDVERSVALANEDRQTLLDAATVNDERGSPDSG